jgi:hypothetical protein
MKRWHLHNVNNVAPVVFTYDFPDGDRVVLESYGEPMFARVDLAEKLEALAAAATEAAKELRGG